LAQRVFLFFLLVAGFSYGIDLGTFGSVYNIAEKDIIEELKERASSIDYDKIRKEYRKKIRNYRPSDIVFLEKAKESRVYYHIPWAVVPEDIWGVQDGRLVLLYEKGAKFNPLKYLPYKPIDLVVFNGADEGELKFVKKYFSKERVAFLITDGSYYEVSKRLNRRVFYFSGNVDRLGVRNTISRVTVDGDRLKITVFAVSEEGELVDGNKYVVRQGFLFKKKKMVKK